MLSFRLALRYLFSKTRLHAVNYVTAVSALALAVVSMALVCVLSVYNGYVELILEGTEQTDAELLLRPSEGTILNLAKLPQLESSLKSAGVASYTLLLESKGLLRAHDQQWVVDVLGIDHHFPKVFAMADSIASGKVLTEAETGLPSEGDTIPVNIGAGINLSLASSHRSSPAPDTELLFPRRLGFINPLAPSSAFTSLSVQVVGQYASLSLETDHTLYLPLPALRSALDYSPNEVSAIGLRFPSGANLSSIQAKLSKDLGSSIRVLSREEQHPDLSYLIRMEKVMTYLILLFILLLAAFNVASSLTMLLLEKQEDTRILTSLGAKPSMVGAIFRRVGFLISVLGSASGLVLGLIVCVLQQKFGLITAGVGLSLQPLPIAIHWDDLVLTFLTVTLISYLISLYPTRLFLRRGSR